MTHRLRSLAFALLCATALPVLAQDGGELSARNAAQELEAAVAALSEAGSGSEQIAVLTQTVQSYEAGLSALREGLRHISTQKDQISSDFSTQASDIGEVLAIMGAISRTPPQLQMLHPTGTVGTVRAAMLMAQLTPALNTEAAELRARLRAITEIEQQQKAAVETLEEGLARVHTAREALARAMSSRTDLPQRFEENAENRALLLASATTLAEFADGLAQTIGTELIEIESDAWNRMGKLALPLSNATIVSRYNVADAAGVKRPGLQLATAPQSLVSTPITATIRYIGPLLELGTVVILEPGPGVLFVFSGLAEGYGKIGQVVPEGTPVGIMGGSLPQTEAVVAPSKTDAAQSATQTLYLEVREGKSTADPAAWFVLP